MTGELRRCSLHGNAQNWAMNHKKTFTIESEIDDSIIYAIENGIFAIMKGNRCYLCKLEHISAMINACHDESIAAEISEVYKEHKRLEIFGVKLS